MKKIYLLLLFLIVLLGFYLLLVRAPKLFPLEKVITIDKKLSAQEVGQLLKETHVIQSPLLFKFLIKNNIKAGEYYFTSKNNIFAVIARLKSGVSGVPMVKVTIPEGSNNEEIAYILFKKMPAFNGPLFLKKAYGLQGYLFPDTYSIPYTADEAFIISLLKNTFTTKVKVATSDEIKMASLLEEEGNTEESRKIISDILWRRLHMGMALQVDVYKLSYSKKGLPPEPITNPGLESIIAAQTPTKNEYLYYISDEHGTFHYAKTYEQHLVNIQKYLKK